MQFSCTQKSPPICLKSLPSACCITSFDMIACYFWWYFPQVDQMQSDIKWTWRQRCPLFIVLSVVTNSKGVTRLKKQCCLKTSLRSRGWNGKILKVHGTLLTLPLKWYTEVPYFCFYMLLNWQVGRSWAAMFKSFKLWWKDCRCSKHARSWTTYATQEYWKKICI